MNDEVVISRRRIHAIRRAHPSVHGFHDRRTRAPTPSTRGGTAPDTSTSPGSASAIGRAAMCTAMPCTSSSTISSSPVCKPARMGRPMSAAASRIARAQWIARAGPSNVASAPSPVNCRASLPRAARLLGCVLPVPSSKHHRPKRLRTVGPTMSVNKTVDSTRLVANDSISSSSRPESLANHSWSSPAMLTSRARGISLARYCA